MAKRVTITDVARETGVSIKTVSNVLNNTGSMRPETRQRVQDAIERLGYRVNVSARAMKTGGTKLIGLAITDFCQPFMPYLADSIVAAARSRGYAVITDTYNSAGDPGDEEAGRGRLDFLHGLADHGSHDTAPAVSVGDCGRLRYAGTGRLGHDAERGGRTHRGGGAAGFGMP